MVMWKFDIGRAGAAFGILAAAMVLAAMPLEALTLQECSTAYKKAKQSGRLGTMGWQAFRRANCGPKASPAAPGLPPGGSTYLPGGRAVFPTAIAPKYGDETPARARRQTCLDQSRLNKASNANGGLRWVEGEGGYYSECSRRLKSGGKAR